MGVSGFILIKYKRKVEVKIKMYLYLHYVNNIGNVKNVELALKEMKKKVRESKIPYEMM